MTPTSDGSREDARMTDMTSKILMRKQTAFSYHAHWKWSGHARSLCGFKPGTQWWDASRDAPMCKRCEKIHAAVNRRGDA